MSRSSQSRPQRPHRGARARRWRGLLALASLVAPGAAIGQDAPSSPAWRYNVTADPVTQAASSRACILAQEPFVGRRPYKVATPELCLFESGKRVLVQLKMAGAGKIVCRRCVVRVRSNSRPARNTKAMVVNGDTDTLTFIEGRSVARLIAGSERFTVEPVLDTTGRVSIRFNVSALAWTVP